MKKHLASAMVAGLLVATCFTGAACSTVAGADLDDLYAPRGTAPVMPVGHDNRFEATGANGCYGCHGGSVESAVLLAQATPLPADHYVDGSVTTYQIDPVRMQCYTCHVTS